MVEATHINGDDYTWPARLVQPDLRTADRVLSDEIAGLRAEVTTLASAFARQVDVIDARLTPVPGGVGGLPGGRAAVLITRRDQVIESRHVVVYHQQVHDAPGALRSLQRANWVFVHPTESGAVLDALGVQADATASA